MEFWKVVFWVLLFLLFYTYLGYGLLIWLLNKLLRGKKNEKTGEEFLPDVTFMVAAWNEKNWIEAKIQNSLHFDYPSEKLHLVFVTDGSDDGTPDIINRFPFPENCQWQLFHHEARRGKNAAIERVMPFVKTPIVIFSDANTQVNKKAIKKMVAHYSDPQVGAVAGEKRVVASEKDTAASNEGIYWKYESFLKRLDSDFYSVVGAAGELFSIRTELFFPVPNDTIVEDFMLTMGIAQKGYKVKYEPEAYAEEGKSASISEELKRKVRIAAGGFQSIVRLSDLLNIFKYGRLSFQYVSHRVLRWTLAPLSLPLLFVINFFLALQYSGLYNLLFGAQFLFYFFALIGWGLEKQKLKFKTFFVPYYFCVMNLAMYKGFARFMKGNQSVLWEKAKRA